MPALSGCTAGAAEARALDAACAEGDAAAGEVVAVVDHPRHGRGETRGAKRDPLGPGKIGGKERLGHDAGAETCAKRPANDNGE